MMDRENFIHFLINHLMILKSGTNIRVLQRIELEQVCQMKSPYFVYSNQW